MALSWVLRDGDVTSVLIGASKPEQIRENVKIVEKQSSVKKSLDELMNCQKQSQNSSDFVDK